MISPCGGYRWTLSRDVGQGSRRLLWVMLNPSTADDLVDDATVRRVKGMTRDAGFGAADVVNLYAWRATDPTELRRVADPVGPRCDYWIERMCAGADAAVLAWGASGAGLTGFPSRAAEVERLVLEQVELVFTLGRTQAGLPRHPLFVRSSTTWTPVGAPCVP